MHRLVGGVQDSMHMILRGPRILSCMFPIILKVSIRTRMLFSRVTRRKSLKYHFIVFGVAARGGHFRKVSKAGTRLRPPSDRAFNILPRWPPGGAGAHPPRHIFQFIIGDPRGRNARWQHTSRELCGIAWLLQFLRRQGAIVEGC